MKRFGPTRVRFCVSEPVESEFETSGKLIVGGIIGPGPADSDGDGVLRTGEFLPDLNGDGAVWWLGGDNFDNRSPAEISDTGHGCIGCAAGGATPSVTMPALSATW